MIHLQVLRRSVYKREHVIKPSNNNVTIYVRLGCLFSLALCTVAFSALLCPEIICVLFFSETGAESRLTSITPS